MSEVTYRTINLYTEEERYIYFYADPPNLVKTARNCLHHSGPQGTRTMETGDEFILWEHVGAKRYKRLFSEATKTHQHINLTPYSTMKVKLAAQVLSGSVANVLKKDYRLPKPAYSLRGRKVEKPLPRSLQQHQRLAIHLVRGRIYRYLLSWKISLDDNEELTAKEREVRFLSRKTCEGCIMSFHSLTETSLFVLGAGMSFFLPKHVTGTC